MQFFDIRTSKSAPKTTVFQHFHFQMCFSPLRRFKKCPKDYSFSTLSLPNLLHSFRHQNFKKCSEDFSFFTFSLPNVLFATAACNFSTSELQKVLRRLQFLQHFHFQMRFSPQRPAIFRHQNFKKRSDTVSFLTFSLPNVLFATAACNFSTSEL